MRASMDERNGEDMAEDKHRNGRLFSDISAAQVIATALAAVTSMLLSSYIGIAGSVIGVAVASVVSTLAASIYKKFLRDSAEKIKELPLPIVHASTSKPHAAEDASTKTSDEPRQAASEHAVGNEHVDEPASDEGCSADSESSETANDGESASREANASSEANDTVLSPAKGAAGPDEKRLVRGLIIVCVVSALLTVAASGAAVYLLTTGEGLGARPAPIYVSAPQSTASHDDGSSTVDVDVPDAEDKGSSEASSSGTSSNSSSSSSAPNASSSFSSSSSASSGSSSSSASSSGSSSAPSSASSSSGTGPSSKDEIDAAAGSTTIGSSESTSSAASSSR